MNVLSEGAANFDTFEVKLMGVNHSTLRLLLDSFTY